MCFFKSLCCGPMPSSLQRLSIIVQSILAIIECPVCLDTISPPAMQCQNGHLLCVNCRIRSVNCPVCRDRYTPRRALIAEQIYTAITNAFKLCRNEDKLRQKLFGPKAKSPNVPIKLQSTPTADSHKYGKTFGNGHVQLPTNKFLSKLLKGKASSMENISSSSSNNAATANDSASCLANKANLGVLQANLKAGVSTPSLIVAVAAAAVTSTSCAMSGNNSKLTSNCRVASSNDVTTTAENHSSLPPSHASYTLNVGGITNAKHLAATSAISKQFSLSTNDISEPQLNLQYLKGGMNTSSSSSINSSNINMAIPRCPSMQHLNHSCPPNGDNFLVLSDSTKSMSTNMPAYNSPLLYVNNRRPCNSLNSSTECIRRHLKANNAATTAETAASDDEKEKVVDKDG